MAEIRLQGNSCISLGTIDSDEDLKPRQGLIDINPPPSNGKCDCCGRHLSELKPFGKAGDPLVGDFHGALLVKKIRTCAPYDEEAESIYQEYLGRARTESHYEGAEQLMAPDYGTEEAEPIRLTVEQTLAIEETVARLRPAG